MSGISERMKYLDVSSIYDLWNVCAAAVNDGNLDRLVSLWADDGVQLPPDGPIRAGREEIWAAMQILFDRFVMSKMIVHTEEVQIFGDRAYAYGTFSFERIPKKRGEKMCFSGKFLAILAKQADGSWKIAVDCHNDNAS